MMNDKEGNKYYYNTEFKIGEKVTYIKFPNLKNHFTIKAIKYNQSTGERKITINSLFNEDIEVDDYQIIRES